MRWIEDFNGERNDLTLLNTPFQNAPLLIVAISFNLNRLWGVF
jgi:hypothetical protein